MDAQARDQLVNGIYQLESSGGLQDGCKRQGMVNGYGFRQNKSEFKCFNSVSEVRKLVENWIEDKQNKGWSVAEQACYYNLGLRVSDCPYYQNYLRITYE